MTMKVRLGVFGARADRRGLAIQCEEFCRHLGPLRVFGIDMKDLSPYYCDWRGYNQSSLTTMAHNEITADIVRSWLEGLDVVWGAETFYFPWFTGLAREAGVRTCLAVNPEFIAHVLAPDWQPLPDRLIPPTDWRLSEIPQATVMPHGVCRHRLAFRRRTEAKTFLVVAGHPAAFDRAGVQTVLDSLTTVRNECRVVIRTQQPLRMPGTVYGAPRPPRNVTLDIRLENTQDYTELYEDGDVLLTPRRYGGQHLPLWEAMSCGLPVLATNCAPQNGWLPAEMLVPGTMGRTFFSKSGHMDLTDMDPRALALRMDQMIENPDMVARLSDCAGRLAAERSWPALIGRYRSLFDSL